VGQACFQLATIYALGSIHEGLGVNYTLSARYFWFSLELLQDAKLKTTAVLMFCNFFILEPPLLLTQEYEDALHHMSKQESLSLHLRARALYTLGMVAYFEYRDVAGYELCKMGLDLAQASMEEAQRQNESTFSWETFNAAESTVVEASVCLKNFESIAHDGNQCNYTRDNNGQQHKIDSHGIKDVTHSEWDWKWDWQPLEYDKIEGTEDHELWQHGHASLNDGNTIHSSVASSPHHGRITVIQSEDDISDTHVLYTDAGYYEDESRNNDNIHKSDSNGDDIVIDDTEGSFCDVKRLGQYHLFEEAVINRLNARVRRLLEDASMLPNDVLNTRGDTGLTLAIRHRNVQAVQMLIEYGADVFHPVTLRNQSGSCSSSSGFDAENHSRDDLQSCYRESTNAVNLAASLGYSKELELLCQSSTFWTLPNSQKNNSNIISMRPHVSLYDATWSGHLESVRVLLAFTATESTLMNRNNFRTINRSLNASRSVLKFESLNQSQIAAEYKVSTSKSVGSSADATPLATEAGALLSACAFTDNNGFSCDSYATSFSCAALEHELHYDCSGCSCASNHSLFP
jgi:ankyrin repeat protein